MASGVENENENSLMIRTDSSGGLIGCGWWREGDARLMPQSEGGGCIILMSSGARALEEDTPVFASWLRVQCGLRVRPGLQKTCLLGSPGAEDKESDGLPQSLPSVVVSSPLFLSPVMVPNFMKIRDEAIRGVGFFVGGRRGVLFVCILTY